MKSDYEIYLDKYCKARGFCREEAERHLIVQEYKKMCERRENEHENLTSHADGWQGADADGAEHGNADVPEDRGC